MAQRKEVQSEQERTVPWRRSSSGTTATGLARANEVVWGVAGVVMSVRARGESEGRTTATRRGGVLAHPGRVLTRSGMSWASWALHVLVVAVLFVGQGGYMRALESEVSLVDTVRVTREGR
jgi:hypothetical protein